MSAMGGSTPPGGDTPGPMGAPMSTPEPKNGKKESAMINLGMAQDLIEQSLPNIGSETEEGQALVAALRALTKVIGPRKAKTGELQQSEILQLMQGLPQGAGAPAAQAPGAAMPPGGAPPPSPAAPPMPGAGGAPPPM